MSIRHKTGLAATVLTALAITVTGCDSAVITGTGSEPGIGAAMAEPESQLLTDGSFELGAATWESCSDNGNSDLDSDASDGDLALRLANGACRYQNLLADAADSYRLTCDAKQNAEGWSSVTLAFLDQNFRPLDSQELPIESDSYTTIDITMTAPPFTSRTEVLFYSDGAMSVDNCELNQVTLEVPAVQLQNGSFSDGLTAWSQCAGTDATVTNGVASIVGGACINQTIDVSESVAASAVNDPFTISFQCDQITKTGDQYAAAIVAFLDENNEPLANDEQAINQGTTSTAVRLSAPANTQVLEVMLYSDGQTSIGQCNVTTL